MKIANKIIKIKRLIKNIEDNLEINYPLTESKKILLISLEKERIALSECINLALILEDRKKLIKPSRSKEQNLENFFNICCRDLGITNEESLKIKEVLSVSKSLRESSMDFKRNEEIVLLSKDLAFKKISLKKLKEYKNLIEILLKKIVLIEKLR